jgi:hypothetical protein
MRKAENISAYVPQVYSTSSETILLVDKMADFLHTKWWIFSSNASLKEDGHMRQADKQAVRQLGHNRQKINLKKTIGRK